MTGKVRAGYLVVGRSISQVMVHHPRKVHSTSRGSFELNGVHGGYYSILFKGGGGRRKGVLYKSLSSSDKLSRML